MQVQSERKIQKTEKYTQGKWTRAQNDRFMKALELYGRNWPLVQKKVKTRSIVQVRSHAQKVFQNMSKQDIDALICGNEDQTEEEDWIQTYIGQPKKENFVQKSKKIQKRKNSNHNLMKILKDQVQKEDAESPLTAEEAKPFKEINEEEERLPEAINNSMFTRIFYQNLKYFQNGGCFLFLTPSFEEGRNTSEKIEVKEAKSKAFHTLE